MSLRIILNEELLNQSKQINLREHCFSNKEIIITKNIEHNNIIEEQATNNGLINAFISAYNNHCTLKIRPDDIHLCINFIFNHFINIYPELFNKSEYYKVDLKINNYPDIEKIDRSIFIEHPIMDNLLTPNYSTTTDLIKKICKLSVLGEIDIIKNKLINLSSGIPDIILEGTLNDWYKLNNIFEKFKLLFVHFNNDFYDWYDNMEIIMDSFVEMRKLQDYGTVVAPEFIKELWNRFIIKIPSIDKDKYVIGGWINLFCPILNNKIKKFKYMKCLQKINGKLISIPKIDKNYDYYYWKNELNEFYSDLESNLISSYICKIKILIHTTEFIINYGFNPNVYYDNNIISTNLMYYVSSNNIFDNKKKYLEFLGFININGILKYPKKYHNTELITEAKYYFKTNILSGY